MTVAFFEHIGTRHPFADEIGRLRDLVNSNAEVARVLESGGVEPPTIHAEVKAVPSADGAFAFDRFYWSAQVKPRGRAPGLAAITLTAAPQKGQLDWLTFPADPYLTRASEYLSRAEGSTEVLRYVPLRRLTFVETRDDGVRRIGKFKRRSRFKEAYSILSDVAHAASQGSISFSVSKPLGLDDERALYFQSSLSGEPVPDLVTGETGDALMAAIGAVHADVHRMTPWARLPVLGNGDLLSRAKRDIALIGFYVEELGQALLPFIGTLEKAFPADGLQTVCHGDFVASQLLLDAGAWSVIDFDLVMLADPYHDISIFLASLDYDVPWIEAQASDLWKARFGAEYLRGYAGRSGRAIDRRRLAWHRLSAEIYYLALMLKKDRFELARALRRIADMRAIAEDLA